MTTTNRSGTRMDLDHGLAPKLPAHTEAWIDSKAPENAPKCPACGQPLLTELDRQRGLHVDLNGPYSGCYDRFMEMD